MVNLGGSKAPRCMRVRGWSVFWDRRIQTGETWAKCIGKPLDEARCVVVAWSEAAIESSSIYEEADRARQRNVLVPVLFHEVLPPPGFEAIQAARLTDWDGTNPSPVLQEFIAELVRRPVEKEASRETAPQEVPTTSQKGVPGTVFRDTLQDGSKGPEMVVIPAGEFWMGSDKEQDPAAEDDELPRHQVRIRKPFALGR